MGLEMRQARSVGYPKALANCDHFLSMVSPATVPSIRASPLLPRRQTLRVRCGGPYLLENIANTPTSSSRSSRGAYVKRKDAKKTTK